jgi:small subunit ribosomal protein S16e
VQVFGRKKTATAVAHCKEGHGLIKINGSPIHLIQPLTLREKVSDSLLELFFFGASALVSVQVEKGDGHGSGPVCPLLTFMCAFASRAAAD